METAELTPSEVADKVRGYVAKTTVGDITLWLDETRIKLQHEIWRIPIRPSREPNPLFPYYDALADLEQEMQDKEGINISISSGDPLNLQGV